MSPGAESLAILTTLMALGHRFSYSCAGLFAGKPAPTGTAQVLNIVQSLWERVYPRSGRHSQHQIRGWNQLSSQTSRAQCHTDSQLSSPTISSSASHSTTVPSSSTQ